MLVLPQNNQIISEFEKIKQLAEAECLSQPGRNLMKRSTLQTDFSKVEFLLKQTNEFRKIILNGEPFPTDGFTDATKEIQLLGISNSVLQSEALLCLLKFTRGSKDLLSFFNKRSSLYPLFGSLAEGIFYEPTIIKKIEEVLDDAGMVKSTASPDLARIRRVLARKRTEADKLYLSIIQKYKKKGWIAGSEGSMRNGRRVINILAEQKRIVKGIVHDISSTGKTVFVEPEETISVNNELYDLEQDEKREIQRILKALSEALRPFVNMLLSYSEFMALCDYSRARSLFAISTYSGLPCLVDFPVIDLKNARHPLLFLYNKTHKKETVPFSLRLDKNRILVISGPNAGGKTVCMKTIGLSQLMLQSGFLIPADENSIMGIFEKLLVDLGDSQSLEYELSTYSSRLALMKTFLDECNSKTLFLIDEFGTGTDPNLGGALAEAVLEELNRKEPFGIITTHYLNLKLLADRTPGIINGSMEFAPKELKPLYRLIVGKPGSSYTFVVAERSGLPKPVIKSASLKIDRKSFDLEKLLSRVENDKNFFQEKAKEALIKEKKLNDLIRKYSSLMSENEKTRDNLDKKIKEKEARLVEDMNRMFKGFLKEWKVSGNKKSLVERFSRQLEIKYNKLVKDKPIREEIKKHAYDPSLFKKGTAVKLNGGSTIGKIESIDGSKARVLFGDFFTLCKLEDLVPAETNSRE